MVSFTPTESLVFDELKKWPRTIDDLERALDHAKEFSECYVRVIISKINRKAPLVGSLKRNGMHYYFLKPESLKAAGDFRLSGTSPADREFMRDYLVDMMSNFLSGEDAKKKEDVRRECAEFLNLRRQRSAESRGSSPLAPFAHRAADRPKTPARDTAGRGR